MAGIDYVSCNECGKRLFYDGEGDTRNCLKAIGNTKTLTCDACVQKLKKKIAVLVKHDRRKH